MRWESHRFRNDNSEEPTSTSSDLCLAGDGKGHLPLQGKAKPPHPTFALDGKGHLLPSPRAQPSARFGCKRATGTFTTRRALKGKARAPPLTFGHLPRRGGGYRIVPQGHQNFSLFTLRFSFYYPSRSGTTIFILRFTCFVSLSVCKCKQLLNSSACRLTLPRL